MTGSGTIAQLGQAEDRSWPNIVGCQQLTTERRQELQTLLHEQALIPADSEFVVFGSLARGEVTQGSDIDWTLLVDGPADPNHKRMALAIEQALADADFKRPGKTGTFGGLTFSHDVIHRIGGEEDTNLNTTRRVLLLLESFGIGVHGTPANAGVRDRVLGQLFRRYLDEDRGYHSLHGFRVRVPRLLLNDVVRYWRTMAVDYAAKRSDRDWSGWAIRNFKLRTSRKLMFAAGLAMCLFCELRPSLKLTELARDGAPEAEFYSELSAFLRDFTNKAPLEILAEFGQAFGASASKATCDALDQYDKFLETLNDQALRETLEKLDFEDAAADPTYQATRAIGTEFQKALTQLFFGSDDELTKRTQRYGVF